MLTILGGLAEFERELIKARTAEGRERAKGRGVRMGRKHKLTPHQQEEVRKRKAEGQSVRELGGHTTCRRIRSVASGKLCGANARRRLDLISSVGPRAQNIRHFMQ